MIKVNVIHSFIHLFKNFCSASSSPLLLIGDPNYSSKVKKNGFKTIVN